MRVNGGHWGTVTAVKQVQELMCQNPIKLGVCSGFLPLILLLLVHECLNNKHFCLTLYEQNRKY